ncbi:transporter [Paraburkholderia sp. GAS348]|uniref:transporter n=1 Tax=Paraburkholderia sp. GAS348 TaxID=3035132 RepID=UPI003D246855
MSLNYGVEFYTTNNQTRYHNTPVSVLNVLALKCFGADWGVGVVGGYIQQLGHHTGGLADLVGGAQEHSVGVGPMVTWNGKISKTPVGATLRSVKEFNVSNRPKGNAVELSHNATVQ